MWMQEAIVKLEKEEPQSVEEAEILEWALRISRREWSLISSRYLAYSLYQQGNVRRALFLTKRLVEIAPNHPRAKVIKGRMRVEREERDYILKRGMRVWPLIQCIPCRVTWNGTKTCWMVRRWRERFLLWSIREQTMMEFPRETRMRHSAGTISFPFVPIPIFWNCSKYVSQLSEIRTKLFFASSVGITVTKIKQISSFQRWGRTHRSRWAEEALLLSQGTNFLRVLIFPIILLTVVNRLRLDLWSLSSPLPSIPAWSSLPQTRSHQSGDPSSWSSCCSLQGNHLGTRNLCRQRSGDSKGTVQWEYWELIGVENSIGVVVVVGTSHGPWWTRQLGTG